MHEFSIASAVVDTAVRHAGGRRVTVVTAPLRRGCARSCPTRCEFAFGIVARETALRGRAARRRGGARAAALRRVRATTGRSRSPAFRCPTCGTADVAVLSGEELEVESIEVTESEEAGCTA